MGDETKSIKYMLWAKPPGGEWYDVTEEARAQGTINKSSYVGMQGALSKEHLKVYASTVSYVRNYVNLAEYIFTSPLSGYKDYTFELRRALDAKWREREELRMQDEYVALPPEWGNLSIDSNHYLHVAFDAGDLDRVAYTENEQKGMRDIQTQMKAGRYLAKFHPELTNEQVRYYSEAIQSMSGIQMTDDPDLAATIYENGPESCMSKPPQYWSWCKSPYKDQEPIDPMPRHPVAAYFGGDLQLAWIGDPKCADARALIWPEKKEYGRIYGAIDRMKTALQRMGYHSRHSAENLPQGMSTDYVRNGSTFGGARVKVIRFSPDHIVMPYLDGVVGFEYVKATKQLLFGCSYQAMGKSSEVARISRTGGECGLTQFRDPSIRYCVVSKRIIKDDDEVVQTDLADRNGSSHGGIALKSALNTEWVLTVEGYWSKSPIYVEDEDEVTIHWRHYGCPYGYVQDVLDRPRIVYRPRKLCMRLVDDEFTRRGNKDKLICYHGQYYKDMASFRMYNPSLVVSFTGEIEFSLTPKEQEHMDKLCLEYIKYNRVGYGYTTVDEACYADHSFYCALVRHFFPNIKKARITDRLAEELRPAQQRSPWEAQNVA